MKKYQTLKSKSRQSQGFTIIEVSLFLALTGLVIIGIIGTFSSVSRQRYNDSVQSFAEYLRNLYSQVENIRNNGGNCKCVNGQSNTCCGQGKTAFYGKIVSFVNSGSQQTITAYDVIGSAHADSELVDTKQALGAEVNINNRIRDGVNIRFISGDRGETYTPTWQAKIQAPQSGGNFPDFSGSILIVRSPSSGIIHTYHSDETVTSSSNLVNWLDGADDTTPVNFCVFSSDFNSAGGDRRNVRIIADAHNASGVELIADDGGSACKPAK